MRLHRFFVSQKLEEGKEIHVNDKTLLHQWKDVFRLKAGDSVILLDNSGFEFHSTLSLLSSKDGAKLTIQSIKKSLSFPKKEINLFVSLLKKDNFEWVLEKATELGVSHIIPILAERSEKKDFNKERAQKIFVEASEQSCRGTLPVLHDIYTPAKALDKFDVPCVALHLAGDPFDVEKYVSHDKLGIFIGPEGGWSDKEMALFFEKQIPVCTLGPQVLRAETASIAVLALTLL